MESSRDCVENEITVFTQQKKVDGKIQGIHNIVEDDCCRVHLLQQRSAATRALQAEALHILDDRMEHCVINTVKADADEKDAKLCEASMAVARLVKS